MIAYLENKDVTVEVPDDIGDAQLADIAKNFDSYVQPDAGGPSPKPVPTPAPTPAAATLNGPQKPNENPGGTDAAPKPFVGDKWMPDFYKAYIEPNLNSFGPMALPMKAGESPEARAFLGQASNQLSFGLTKPILDPALEADYANHPVYAAGGALTGGLGSLLAAGAITRVAGLGEVAVAAGEKATPLVAAAPRFIPRAIMSGGTFGTQTFVKQAVKTFLDGNIDPIEFGRNLVTDTALGATLGAIGGVAKPSVAVFSAAGLGYTYTKMEGGSHQDALLNASIWGLFELVGSSGRSERLNREAINTLGKSAGEYVAKRNPNLSPEQAEAVGHAIVAKETAPYGGVEAVVKSKETTLETIESLNQKLVQARVQRPSETVAEPAKLANDRPEPKPVTPAGEPAPAAPAPEGPFTLKPDVEQLALGRKVEAAPVENAPRGTVSEPAPAREVKYDKDGLPVRRPKSVVATVITADGEPAKITHEMILGEAEGMLQEEKDRIAATSTDPIRDKIFQRKLKPEPADSAGQVPEIGEWEDLPMHVKDKKGGVTATELAESINQEPAKYGLEPGQVISASDIYQIAQKYAAPKAPTLADLYEPALARLQEYFANLEFESPEVEVAPGVFFDKRTGEDLFGAPREEVSDRYERLRKQGMEQGLNPIQASKFAQERMRTEVARPIEAKPQQTEMGAGDGVTGFGRGREGEPELFFDRPEPSKGAYGREFGDEKDQTAAIGRQIGGVDQIKKMKGPELVKFAREISGEVPVVKRVMEALGYFRPGDEQIALRADLFKDQKLWEAVLAHEIGHLMDYNPEKTMKRGNILGRIASLKDYRKSLLPEKPGGEPILTDADRRRFRSQAERLAMGEKSGGSIPNEPANQFDPQMILNVWNAVTADTDPNLLDYIKGLNADQKKQLIIGAMQALKKGEKITVYDVKKFNADAEKDLKTVSDIYRDLLKKEIQKRKLWENEVINQELRRLTQFWKPFNTAADPSFTKYRYSSPELYADFVSVLLNAPAKAKEIAPSAYTAFFNYLENKPEIMKNLLELQALIQADDADLQKVRGEDIVKMFERAEDAFRARQLQLEAAQKRTWDKLRVLVWDANALILDERNKLAKREPLPPSSDAKYALERNSMIGTVVKSHLEDFDQLVYQPAKDAGVLQDVKVMLFLDRVGDDRAEMANPLGHTPETAKALLEHMKREDPTRFEKVSSIAQAARDWFRNLAQIPGGEDFFTPEQFFVMQSNPKYAPFRVQDFMRDYMSAGFAQQAGTLKDIGDPLTSMAMKGVSVVTAIERNAAKKIVGEMLLRSGIQMKPAKITQYPGVFKIADPEENFLGTIAWKSGGKWQAYHVDKFMADAINRSPIDQMNLLGGTINTVFKNNWARNVFIVFNATFQSKNLIKDFMRTWRNAPGLTIGKALRLYRESLPEANARAQGQYDPIIQQMERDAALQLTYNDLILGETGEDQELESVLQRFDIVKNRKTKKSSIPLVSAVLAPFDYLRYIGDLIETLPKVAGYKALEDLPAEERAYRVRNLIGTPNPKRKGTATPVTNSLLLFTNVWKEGLRGMYEAAFEDKKNRGDYWSKMMIQAVLPKVLMAAAVYGAHGLFGDRVKRVMDKMSDYQKTNYNLIPIGEDEKGNGISFRLPVDEEARLVGAIFWKAFMSSGNPIENVREIVSIPGVSPVLSVGGTWLDFLSGKNPRDDFRGEDILTEDQQAAGGLRAFWPMVEWTINQTGVTHFDVHDRYSEQPLYKKIIPWVPGLQGFLVSSRQGEREHIREFVAPVIKAEAEKRLIDQEKIVDAIRSNQSLEDFISSAAQKDRKDLDQLINSFDRTKLKASSDPAIQEILRAPSSDQKVAVLEAVRSRYEDKKAFEEFVQVLYLKKVISPEVASRALQ